MAQAFPARFSDSLDDRASFKMIHAYDVRDEATYPDTNTDARMQSGVARKDIMSDETYCNTITTIKGRWKSCCPTLVRVGT